MLRQIALNPTHYFHEKIEKIYYFHARYSKPDLDAPWITCIEGPPTDLSVLDVHEGRPTLVFIDDLGDYFLKKPGRQQLNELYNVISRHRNFGIFTVIHSAFDHDRSVRLSTNYFIMFNNYSDFLAPSNLISQIFGPGAAPVISLYRAEMARGGFPYLVIDNHTNSDSRKGIRLFTDIDQEHATVFLDPSENVYKPAENHAADQKCPIEY